MGLAPQPDNLGAFVNSQIFTLTSSGSFKEYQLSHIDLVLRFHFSSPGPVPVKTHTHTSYRKTGIQSNAVNNVLENHCFIVLRYFLLVLLDFPARCNKNLSLKLFAAN